MHWIQSMSFSSAPSASSATPPHSPSPSSSPKPLPFDESLSPSKRQSSRNRSNLRGGGGGGGAAAAAASLASRVGSGTAGAGVRSAPKLTRQRKLRHLTDQDVVGAKSAPVLPADADVLSRSVSAPSCAPPPSARMLTSVPMPLPLPLPVPENSNSGDGDSRLPSPPMERDRDRADGAGEGIYSSPSISPTRRGMVSQDIRKMPDHPETRSSRVVHPESSNADNARNNKRPNDPVRSAPNSPFTSPLRSQQRIVPASDSFPYHNNMLKGSQGWSAPEMASLDVPGLPPPAYFDFGALSNDNSPLHSPPSSWNPRSPSGPASPLRAKLSAESSTARRESNGNLGVHPLPLPPGAVVHHPSLHVPQVVAKPEPTLKSQWLKGKLIGRGTFGSVYVASNRETGALCAMKEVELFPDDPKSAESIKQLEQEIKVLSQLKHPNIVQYYGSEIVEDRFYIYLEYVHPGSINKYVREHCGAVTESVVRSFTRHILSGLTYLHSTKTIHRDIKGANLLVDAYGVVKLADFGMAKCLTGQAAELSLKGSPYWMAPELMQAVMQKDTSSDLALAVDIWSLGCTIIEMLNGKPPWSEYEGAAAMFKVLKDAPPIPETLSLGGRDFLSCCFRRNPAERPTASKLLEHCWLKHSPQGDLLCSTQSTCPMRLMDMPYSPRSPDVKLDQLPIFLSPRTVKGKLASESKTGQRSQHETSNLTVMAASRCCRPMLQVLPASSPLHSRYH